MTQIQKGDEPDSVSVMSSTIKATGQKIAFYVGWYGDLCACPVCLEEHDPVGVKSGKVKFCYCTRERLKDGWEINDRLAPWNMPGYSGPPKSKKKC